MMDPARVGSQPSSSIKVVHKVDRQKADPQNVAAADGMEAMFMDYMLKVMRQTVPKSEYSMRSTASDVYQGMLDSEIAQKSVGNGGLGLSDLVLAYLESSRYNQRGGQEAQPTRPSENRNENGTLKGSEHEDQR